MLPVQEFTPQMRANYVCHSTEIKRCSFFSTDDYNLASGNLKQEALWRTEPISWLSVAVHMWTLRKHTLTDGLKGVDKYVVTHKHVMYACSTEKLLLQLLLHGLITETASGNWQPE